MKKLLTTGAACILFCIFSFAQAPQLFAELGGPSVAGINFDSRFSKKQNGIGGRVGIGGFTIDKTGILFVPVGVNYLIGKPESKNYFELGLNVTYVSAFDNGQEADTDNNLADTWGSFTFGYRYQPQEQGVTFRVSVNPFFAFKNSVFWPFYGGVSVGYKFK
ncbi:MAG: hypothetical protein GXC73_07170 [Chitinophagaceae bacterium]|nr:hypothetical protein [Chitinophagaceae bacterium]